MILLLFLESFKIAELKIQNIRPIVCAFLKALFRTHTNCTGCFKKPSVTNVERDLIKGQNLVNDKQADNPFK